MTNKKLKKIILSAIPLSFFLASANLNVVNAEKTEKTEKAKVEVSFIADDGGSLIDTDGNNKKTIVKSVEDGTELYEILPVTNPDDNYKFNVWEFPEDSKDKDKVNADLREYKATFYPDYNDNNKDDRMEDIVISFETNTTTKFDDKKIKVGETINVPKLLKENHVFLGWFSDSAFKNPVDVESKMLESMKLYAKWSTSDDLTSSDLTVTIRDKEISDQLENHLYDRHKKLDLELDEKALNDKDEIQKIKEETTMTVVHKKIDNRNVGRNYLMKFYDTQENFLFSIVLPYGKTVKTMNESKTKVNEYAIRQTTTITLDEKDFVNLGSELDKYEVRNVQSNATEIVEVYPVIKEKEQPIKEVSQPEEPIKEKENSLMGDIAFYLIGGGVVVIIVTLAYVWKFKLNKNIDKESKEDNQ